MEYSWQHETVYVLDSNSINLGNGQKKKMLELLAADLKYNVNQSI